MLTILFFSIIICFSSFDIMLHRSKYTLMMVHSEENVIQHKETDASMLNPYIHIHKGESGECSTEFVWSTHVEVIYVVLYKVLETKMKFTLTAERKFIGHPYIWKRWRSISLFLLLKDGTTI